MQHNDIERLYQKFLDKQCSKEEAEYLFDYFWQHRDSEEITNLIQRQLEKDLPESSFEDDEEAIIRNRKQLQKKIIQETRERGRDTRVWISAAAMAILTLGALLYFLVPQRPLQNLVAEEQVEDVPPGGNRAFIKLSNGQQTELDRTQTGLISQDGQLVYADGTELLPHSQTGAEQATVYTPKGGQYHIVLPDGTKVWLNADTKLKYPLTFASDQRQVSLDGEAYFEVSTDLNRPFIVSSKGQTIEVLGTHFNVESYPGEPYVKTTLLEGSVKVLTEKSAKILKPGEQAVLTKDDFFVHQIDVEEVIDWQQGDFIFRHQSLEELMKRISRWYQIDVDFGKDVDEKQTFSGQISRYKNLSEVITSLESTSNLQFIREKSKITIIQKPTN